MSEKELIYEIKYGYATIDIRSSKEIINEN